MRKVFLSVIAFVSFASLQAQIKEGSITYDMKIEGLPAEQAAMMGNMETKVSFKNDKSLTEMTSLMFTQTIVATPNGMTMLMDQMGNKIAVKQTKAEMDQAAEEAKKEASEPKITYSNEVKKIAGYDCKKATITLIDKDKKENVVDVWYSDKFDNPNKGNAGQDITKGIKGLPFEFSSNMGPMSIKMTAKSVSTASIPDAKFEVSTEGYKIMSADDLKAMGGQ